MSIRVDTASLIPGALVVGNRGLGVLGSSVPANGTNGASFLFNDLSLPSDANKEIRGLVTAPPTAGDFFAWEDGSFTLLNAPDGTHSFTYRLYEDGADKGTATSTITIGAAGAAVTVAANWTDSPDVFAIAGQVVAPRTVAVAWVDATDVVAVVGTSSAPIAAVTAVVAWTDLPDNFNISMRDNTMSFTRSLARTIKALPTATPFSAPTAGFWNMQDPKKPKGVKDPNATIDISFDWSDVLADMTDSIASHVIVALTGGMVDEGSQTNDGVTTVFISGGEVPEVLPVTCRITTASIPPRIIDRTIYLDLQEQ